MSIADKYMSEVKNKSFRFIPPRFNQNLFRNDKREVMGGELNNSVNEKLENNIIFPDETIKEQMYCYYNEMGECYKGNGDFMDNSSINNTSDDGEDYMNRTRDYYEKYISMKDVVNIPLPSEVLRNFDLDLDEEIDLDENRADSDVNRIFSEIELNNPALISIFSDYQVPSPIAKLITKRIVKLSLQYNNRR